MSYHHDLYDGRQQTTIPRAAVELPAKVHSDVNASILKSILQYFDDIPQIRSFFLQNLKLFAVSSLCYQIAAYLHTKDRAYMALTLDLIKDYKEYDYKNTDLKLFEYLLILIRGELDLMNSDENLISILYCGLERHKYQCRECCTSSSLLKDVWTISSNKASVVSVKELFTNKIIENGKTEWKCLKCKSKFKKEVSYYQYPKIAVVLYENKLKIEGTFEFMDNNNNDVNNNREIVYDLTHVICDNDEVFSYLGNKTFKRVKSIKDMDDVTLVGSQIIPEKMVYESTKSEPVTQQIQRATDPLVKIDHRYDEYYNANKYGKTAIQVQSHSSSAHHGTSTSKTTSEPLTSYTPTVQNRLTYEKGVCGLANIGNSCFMNAALQCLSNVKPLTELLINNRLRFSPNSMVNAYAELLHKLWSGDYKYLDSSVLKTRISEYGRQFKGYSQQDLHEFLSCFITSLKNELTAFTEVNDLFCGTTKTSFKCKECSSCLTNTDDQLCLLNLPIPKASVQSSTGRAVRITVEQCLDLFKTCETIEGWPCDKCNIDTPHMVRSRLDKLPKLLMLRIKMSNDLHLNDGNNAGYIKFEQTLKIKEFDSGPVAYDLMAVVHHVGVSSSSSFLYGSASSSNGFGHYKAYCKNYLNQKWYLFDDSYVKPVDVRDVLAYPAYLLVYMRA